MSTPLAQLLKNARGLPAAFNKTHPVGTTWAGRVTRISVRQRRTDDGTPEFWADGNPIEEVVIAFLTSQRDPEREGDDGERGFYLKWWGEQKAAFIDALKAAHMEDLAAGDMFAARYTGDGPQPKDPKLSPTKLWAFEVKKGSPVGPLLAAASSGNGNGNGNGGVPLPPEPIDDPWAKALADQRTPPPPAPPAPTPVAAQAAPAVDPQAALATVRALIGAGLTDEQIHGAVPSFPLEALAAIRNLPS